MADFDCWDAYTTFESAVKRKERYFRAPDTDSFLRQVLESSGSRQKVIPADHILWRAQLGSCLDYIEQDSEKLPYFTHLPLERMKPLGHSAAEGRVNPKGIPYLYLATDANTAMSEVRPWIGKRISVGRFRTVRELRVIDCSIEHSEDYTCYLEEPQPAERERAVWRDIDRSFSEPVTADDMSADYVPTQVLAEFFKCNGFDGVVYKSLLGGGFNIALFDLSAANIIDCSLQIARRVSFEFGEAGKP